MDISNASLAHRRSERTLRMLAELPSLKTLRIDPGFWVHHLSILANSPSLRFVATGGADLGDDDDDDDSGLSYNASGDTIEVKDSCYGVYGDECFPDSQCPPSDTDDEYL